MQKTGALIAALAVSVSAFHANPPCAGMQVAGDPYGEALWREAARRAAVLDWARINEMPAWYVLQPEKNHAMWMNGKEREALQGEKSINGFGIEVEPGETFAIRVEPRETGEGR